MYALPSQVNLDNVLGSIIPEFSEHQIDAFLNMDCVKSYSGDDRDRRIQSLMLELYHSKDQLEFIAKISSLTAPLKSPNEAPERKVLSIGHKGAEGHVKGNTIASFHRAIELGADMIEFDLISCSDGVLVHHDPLHEETGKWTYSMTTEEARKLMGSDHPTLKEMLQDRILRDSGVDLYFDLKHTKIVRPTMYAILEAVTRENWLSKRFIIATFKQMELLEINAFRRSIPELKELRTAVIIDAVPLSLAKDFESLGCAAVSVGKSCVFPEFVFDCHQRGLQMWAWTPNNESMMDELIRLGVDGICTDFPERVHQRVRIANSSPKCKSRDYSEVNYHNILWNLYGGPISEAREQIVSAIFQARAMLSQVLECESEELKSLENLLLSAEMLADSILGPYISSAEKNEKVANAFSLSSEVGSSFSDDETVLDTVEPNHFMLLDFEKKFLSSALP